MQKLSKLFIFILFFIFLFSNRYSLVPSFAQAPIPEIGLACTPKDTRSNEFHSLRPYQAATCGEAPTARFCSNKLVVFEKFDLTYLCSGKRQNQTINWPCAVDFHVDKHNINITLDESEFPIMGNTEDELDDATKLNEYASWYLNGVIDKKENKEPTDEQVVNFSGPVKKLLPSMIQDVQRIKTVLSYQKDSKPKSPQKGDDPVDEAAKENHDQIVVDNERLSSWGEGDLSFLRPAPETISTWMNTLLGSGLSSLISTGINNSGVDISINLPWDKRTPPLPWDDGTVDDDPNNPNVLKIPFKSQILYQKAYNEWLGKTCVILPIIGLQCADLKIGPIDFIPNKYAELWNFVPLSNNSDKRGVNYLLTGDGPSYVASAGTKSENEQHKDYKNAPLYFAHTQEVQELSALLNKTYKPDGFKEEGMGYPKDVEVIKKGTGPLPETLSPDKQYVPSSDPYDYLDCSAVNVRVNEGDNLFPGDRPNKRELFVEEAEYDITEVECKETWEPPTLTGCGKEGMFPCPAKKSLNCEAEVGIEFKLGTKTPYANEIFKQTVAGSDSTFRKIFPKVGEGSPVECIADIPTTTGVTYALDPDQTQIPDRGELELKETKYPADGGGSGTELTFPHIGSVYEYFLKGIQTALRPKGYGEPIANGNCKPIDPVACGEWEEKLEKSSGGDCGICTSELGDLAKRILTTAGKAYNVPAANIWAAMKHEGADGYQGTTYDFSDENVKKWSNSIECGGEVMPACDESDDLTQPPFGFLSKWFFLDAGGTDALWSSVQKIDPTRDSKEKVSRCNFLDAAYAAANLLSQVSTAPANGIMGCGKWTSFDNSRPGSCSSSYWTDAHVAQSQTVYAGYCVNDSPNRLYTVEDTTSWFRNAKCN